VKRHRDPAPARADVRGSGRRSVANERH
jgi:hypothetical protein